MHYKLFVLTKNKPGDTSKIVRARVQTDLYNSSFQQKDTQHGNFGYCDWFVIVGGRWSETLLYATLNPIMRKQYLKATENVKDWRNRTKIFKEFFPNNKLCPKNNHDPYSVHGEEYDSTLATEQLYNKCIANPPKNEWSKWQDNEPYVIYLNGRGYTLRIPPKEDIINKMWITIVDYHN